MDSTNTSVAIIGAGISGLSAAYVLKKRGVDVTLYEKEGHVGGVIQSHKTDGWLVEQGPNTMLVREQQIWDLLHELELTGRIAKPGTEAKKRYIVKDGKLCAAPMSFADFLKTNLFSTSAKLRLLKEPFIAAPAKHDESIAGFVRRRLGTEPLDYAVNPFVSGIYAGDPKQLSIKHTFGALFEMEQRHGSIAKGFFKRDKKKSAAKRALISFDDGLKQLPHALHQKLSAAVQLNTPVTNITHTATGWKLQLQSGKEAEHRAVVSTLPAHRLSGVWADSKSKKSMKLLADIDYAPMSVLGLGFKRNQIDHLLDGFGMLIPAKEPYSMLGCLFSSSLFEGRAPDDRVLLTCFMGGAQNRAQAGRPADQLIAKAREELDRLLGVSGEPVFTHHQFWEKAIPQYTVGYDKYLNSMQQIEDTNPGFFLAGNYRGGVSVPDCILNGFEMAEGVETYLF